MGLLAQRDVSWDVPLGPGLVTHFALSYLWLPSSLLLLSRIDSVNIHTHLWGSLLSISILSLHLTHHFSLFPILREFLYPITHHSIFYPSSLDASILSTVFKMDLTRNLGEVSSWRDPNWKDSTGFTIFLLSAFTCLGLSATFHTCVCHSQKVRNNLEVWRENSQEKQADHLPAIFFSSCVFSSSVRPLSFSLLGQQET